MIDLIDVNEDVICLINLVKSIKNIFEYDSSVLLKVKSIWKQWYYDELKEYVHYVPVENDFSDLNERIQWCIDNNDKCEEITKNAKQFVINA